MTTQELIQRLEDLLQFIGQPNELTTIIDNLSSTLLPSISQLDAAIAALSSNSQTAVQHMKDLQATIDGVNSLIKQQSFGTVFFITDVTQREAAD